MKKSNIRISILKKKLSKFSENDYKGLLSFLDLYFHDRFGYWFKFENEENYTERVVK